MLQASVISNEYNFWIHGFYGTDIDDQLVAYIHGNMLNVQ